MLVRQRLDFCEARGLGLDGRVHQTQALDAGSLVSSEPVTPAQANKIPIGDFVAEQFTLPFAIESRERFEEVCQAIASKKLELMEVEAKQAAEVSALNLQVSQVQERYAEELGRLRRFVADGLDAAHGWALRNEGSVFAGSRSMGLALAEVWFEVCPASVRVKEGWKESAVIAALRRWRGKAKAYVRWAPEIDRNAIKADRATVKGWQWAKRGLEIVNQRKLSIAPRANAAAAVELKR